MPRQEGSNDSPDTGHLDGMRNRPVAAVLTVFAFVALTPSAATAQSVVAATGLTRTAPVALTPAEYNNTIADLLGFPRGRRALAEAACPGRHAQPTARCEQGCLPAAAAAAGLALAVPVRAWRERLRGHRPRSGPVLLPGRGTAPRGDAFRIVCLRFADLLRLRCVGQPVCARARDLRLDQPRAFRPACLSPAPTSRGTRANRDILAQQPRPGPAGRGGGADGRRHPAGTALSLQGRAGKCVRRCHELRSESLGAGHAPLLLPLGFDARRPAVRRSRVRRVRHDSGPRATGAPDARRPKSATRHCALPPSVAWHRPGTAGRARSPRVRAALRHHPQAGERARRRPGMAGHHGPSASLDEVRDRAVRRAHHLRRRRHVQTH